jgi:predicted AAA+ superfamily ATPase
MNEIYPEEFKEFFKAMSVKMESKAEEYGDSWKRDFYQDLFYRYSGMPPALVAAIPMDTFLQSRLKGEIQEYLKSDDTKELIDIANCCAMLWCRKNVFSLVLNQKSDHEKK